MTTTTTTAATIERSFSVGAVAATEDYYPNLCSAPWQAVGLYRKIVPPPCFQHALADVAGKTCQAGSIYWSTRCSPRQLHQCSVGLAEEHWHVGSSLQVRARAGR